ncbi:DNA gyrase inhibitor YacG [Chromobacterium sp. IIBBL 290-4]|uniref:DNA gyrase inhibitor YacG n=1 Tax=Chromobacterium sp. IIBBL 290-4 TaxID=2953890 RepID=UPI0020B7233A|nr:DNA gyrase inhibitor YacG [Chromobacterium sp. IIBBL 290-4]UTH72267.1 DNA gyrase inhibitor YacG [Chromobacterium sp. IIBBL 290-4]
MPDSVRIVPCPTCRAEVRWEPQSRYRPFCSERCRLIDLGQWADESYRVPAAEESPSGDILPPH